MAYSAQGQQTVQEGGMVGPVQRIRGNTVRHGFGLVIRLSCHCVAVDASKLVKLGALAQACTCLSDVVASCFDKADPDGTQIQALGPTACG